jgi:hypothetical protein
MAKCVVDCNKKCTNVFVGLPSSVNDLKALCRFGLYKNVQYNGLFDINKVSQNEFVVSYLLGDKGYPLISWIMMPYKEER